MSTTTDDAHRESRVDALRARLTQSGAVLLRHESFESIPRGAEVWQLPNGRGTVSIPKPYLLDPPAALAEEVYFAALARAEAAAQ